MYNIIAYLNIVRLILRVFVKEDAQEKKLYVSRFADFETKKMDGLPTVRFFYALFIYLIALLL